METLRGFLFLRSGFVFVFVAFGSLLVVFVAAAFVVVGLGLFDLLVVVRGLVVLGAFGVVGAVAASGFSVVLNLFVCRSIVGVALYRLLGESETGAENHGGGEKNEFFHVMRFDKKDVSKHNICKEK